MCEECSNVSDDGSCHFKNHALHVDASGYKTCERKQTQLKPTNCLWQFLVVLDSDNVQVTLIFCLLRCMGKTADNWVGVVLLNDKGYYLLQYTSSPWPC